MSRFLLLPVLLLVSFASIACDESCQRLKAESKHQVEFPTYLSWKFCEDTKMSFIERDIPSLQGYRTDRMTTKYRGSMRNTKNFIEQRIGWLKECNDYMAMTGKGALFQDEAVTDSIFESMQAVTKELDDLIAGVTYTAEPGVSDVAVAGEKFDHMFKLVDDHKTLLMLKGQFVVRD